MAILTPAELTDYAPSVTFSTNALAEAAINRAESIAYGPTGSGYSLESHIQAEVCSLPNSYEVTPMYFINTAEDVTVEWRLKRIENRWGELDAEYYEISRSRVRIDTGSPIDLYYRSDFGRRAYSGAVYRPLYGHASPELRLTYTTGFDFATDTTDEVKRLKAALGGIIEMQYAASQAVAQMGALAGTAAGSSSSGSGLIVEEKEVQGEARVRYGNAGDLADSSYKTINSAGPSGEPGGLITSYLSVFAQYRPHLPTH